MSSSLLKTKKKQIDLTHCKREEKFNLESSAKLQDSFFKIFLLTILKTRLYFKKRSGENLCRVWAKSPLTLE